MYGKELEQLFDENQIIHYIKPVIRGVLVNIDKEISLWERLFQTKEMQGNSLTLSYQPFTPESVLSKLCEVAFEYFGFDAFYPAQS
jgi:actin-related protein